MMRWLFLPAAATLPLLGFACSDSPAEVPPGREAGREAGETNAGAFVLTYFTIPG